MVAYRLLFNFCYGVSWWVTRLTHSGLSMSDFKLVTEMVPSYDRCPVAKGVRNLSTVSRISKSELPFFLEDFKDIYFWEWLHRLLGRVLGLVFLFPFFYFLFTKQFTKPTFYKSLLLLFLGGFQGFLGWY